MAHSTPAATRSSWTRLVYGVTGPPPASEAHPTRPAILRVMIDGRAVGETIGRLLGRKPEVDLAAGIRSAVDRYRKLLANS